MIRCLLALAALFLAPVAQAQDDLARETARVEDLRSIREIKRLQALWGHYALAGEWKAMAGLVIEGTVLAEGTREYRGRAGIAEWLRETEGRGIEGMPSGRLNLRLYLSPVITLAPDGQSATGRWHEIALTGESGVSADWLGVTHVIEYRKTPEGWRIAGSRPYEHFAGSYDEGWSHQAETLQRAPYHYTPDEAGRLLPDRVAATPGTRANLDRQATLLLRESEALNLVNAYGYYLDRGMYDDIVDLFADDRGGDVAEIDVAGQGRWLGREGARLYLTRFGAPGLDDGELNDRPQLMPLVAVNIEGRTAIVRIVELGMTGQHGAAGYWSVAVQEFALQRDERDKWRIASIEVVPLLRAHYDLGWSDPLRPEMPPLDGGASMIRTGLPAMGYPDHATMTFDFTAFNRILNVGYGFAGRPPAPEPNALAHAEAFDAAENVSNAYGYYIDQFAWALTAELFARAGWKELSYIGTFIGRDRVRDSMIQRYGEGGPNAAFQAIHQKTQPYVTVLGDGARAMIRTRLMQFNSSATGPGSWIGGIYENQVVKEDGVWRIHGMDLDYVWLADYATGWTGVDPAANARFALTPELIAAFNPDAPLRGETFAPYPRLAPMGFHYANPVSGREPALRLTWSDGRRETP